MIAQWDKGKKSLSNLSYYNLFLYMTAWSFCVENFKMWMFFIVFKKYINVIKKCYFFFFLAEIFILLFIIFIGMTKCSRFNHLKFWKKKFTIYGCLPPDIIIIITVIIRFTLWLFLKIVLLSRMRVLRMISSRCQMCSVCHWLK